MHCILIHVLTSSNGIHLLEKKSRKKVRLIIVILNHLKIQSINDVNIPYRALNDVRIDPIR